MGLYNVSASYMNDSSALPRDVHLFQYYTKAYVQNIILTCGILFNIINFIVLRHSKMSATCSIFLQALALSDIGMCAFAIMQMTTLTIAFEGDIRYGYWFNGRSILSLTFLLISLSFQNTSSVIVLVVSGVRAYMIHYPYKFMGSLTPKRIKIICLLVYITITIAISFTMFYLIWKACYKEFGIHPFCTEYLRVFPKITGARYYVVIETMMCGPLMILAYCVCFIMIKVGLRKAVRNSESLGAGKMDKRLEQHKRITKTIMALIIIDTICLVPKYIDFLGVAISPDKQIFNSRRSTGNILYNNLAEIALDIRPAYNIFVYYFTNKEYQKSLKLLVKRLHYFLQGKELKEVKEINKNSLHSISVIQTTTDYLEGDVNGGIIEP